MEEVFNFVQDDLQQDDVFILDLFSEVYCWVGNDAMQKEKEDALKLALEFVEKAPDGRPKDTPVFRVQQGTAHPSRLLLCSAPTAHAINACVQVLSRPRSRATSSAGTLASPR